ncbi:MAG: hypothetical protein DWP98_11690 [Bacteroidetes bacterium]|nr:MAG: hypothetical protein DWP98_11690 [Bacteroidota bacterium]MBL1144003.1 hypothetical protein [Bacteroidota bacterium]NOG56804.1 GSCFA domain-containing protein [Bacteroidota bacterium]
MMKLRTEIPSTKSDFDIDHFGPILLLGSCFAENIGKKMDANKFKTLINPLGISYNPVSLSQLILREEVFNVGEFGFSNELYFNYKLHSEFSAIELDTAIKNANTALYKQHDFLKTCKVVFISLGTAWVHELTSSRQLVNNCHKQEAALFHKRLLAIDEITIALSNAIKHINSKTRHQVQIVFTVSPIRHLKDGFHENQLSKSTLQMAVNEVCKAHENCTYFPSYEILIDDLRDYRFYEADMVHPNKLAIEYIWEKLAEVYFSEKTKKLNKLIQGFNASIAHRPFNLETTKHQDFIKNMIQHISLFQEKEKIDFNLELIELKSKLLSQ